MKSVLAAGLLGLATRAAASYDTKCIDSAQTVCFSLNIPDSTVSSGKGDIFFQITAPSTYQYAALGQGSSMSNANIFVIYTSADGKNVTLSPRKGTGHSEPKFSSSAQVSLLDGSGVLDGKMIANVKCSNCDSWSGGSTDFSSTAGNWIHAFKSGSPLNTDSTSASISQHGGGDAATFEFDYASAKGGNDVNPFAAASASGTGGATVTATTGGAGGSTATSSCVPLPTTGTFASEVAASSVVSSFTSWPSAIPTQFQSAFPSGFPSEWKSHWPTARPTRGGGDDKMKRAVNYCGSTTNGGNTIQPIVSSQYEQQKKMIVAHGVLAALAFVILFPAGAIAIRLANFPGVIWLHAAFQVFAYITYLAAFGLGVYVANQKNLLNNYHPIIGIVLFVVIFFQPIFGFLHHALFKKHGVRTLWSYVHIWIGRIAITLGIINGGLGFKLANGDGVGSHSGMIAYAVIAAIAWLAMVAAAIIGERRKRRAVREDGPPKYEEQAMDTPLESLNPSAEDNAHGYYGRQQRK